MVKCEEIAGGKHIRKQLENQWRSSKLVIHRDVFTSQRQVVQSCLRSAKLTHYSGRVEDYQGDSQKWFHLTDELLNRQKDSTLPEYVCLQHM